MKSELNRRGAENAKIKAERLDFDVESKAASDSMWPNDSIKKEMVYENVSGRKW